MEENKPNYYSIIPAYIRYDVRLNAQQKLMYGEITALSNVCGFCFANNPYFAKLYDVDRCTISRWISKLEKLGYIRVELYREEESNKFTRRIYLSDNGSQRLYQQQKAYDKNVIGPYSKNATGAYDENVKNNNINNNTTSVIIEEQEKKIFYDNVRLTDIELESLKTEFGVEKTDKAIKDLSLYKKSSGKDYKDDFSTIKLWVMDRIIEKEEKLAKVKSPNKMKDMDFDEYYDVGR